jgi:uncharacterized protein (TIRG00374 family)
VAEHLKSLNSSGNRNAPSETNPQQKKATRVRIKKRFLLLLSTSILLTLAVPFWLSGWQGFGMIARLPWWVALLLFGMMLFSWGFNTLRVRHMTHLLGVKIGPGDGALIVMATEFAGVATPASAGMPATYTFFLKKLGLRFGQAMGMVTVLVILDVIFFGLFMSLASLTLALGGRLGNLFRLLELSALILIGGGVLLWVLIRYHRPFFHLVGRWMGRVSWLAKYRYPLARTIVEFIRALRLLNRISRRQQLLLLLATFGYWLPRYCVLAVANLLVSRGVSLAYLFLVQGLLNLGGQVFVLPAGGGGVDAAYGLLMHAFLDPKNIAFTLIVWRAYTFYWYLAVGGPIFLFKTGQAARRLLTR